jgi:DNA-binding transcriptional LysR family regulator
MIDLDKLRVFEAVAVSHSFTMASILVSLTQPGISKHIRQMEEYYGTPLFDRSNKKDVTLTQAGAILYEASREILATIGAAERQIDDLKGLQGGKLRIGSSFPIGVYLLPDVLAEFRDQYPLVEVILDIALSDIIGPKLLSNEIDLGLVSYPPRDPRLVPRVFKTDELIVIVPPNHDWARKQRVKPEDLAGETFIVAARGAGTRTVIEERLKALGIPLPNSLEFGNLEGVKHAVEAGLGISIQARSVVQRELASGSLIGLKLAGMDATIQFLYARRKNSPLTHAAKALVALLEKPAPTARGTS